MVARPRMEWVLGSTSIALVLKQAFQELIEDCSQTKDIMKRGCGIYKCRL